MRLKDEKQHQSAMRISEESLYELIGNELETGEIRKGLWTKAYAQAGGDTQKAEAIYIELRKQSFIDEQVVDQVAVQFAHENSEEVQLQRKYEEAESTRKRSRSIGLFFFGAAIVSGFLAPTGWKAVAISLCIIALIIYSLKESSANAEVKKANRERKSLGRENK